MHSAMDFSLDHDSSEFEGKKHKDSINSEESSSESSSHPEDIAKKKKKKKKDKHRITTYTWFKMLNGLIYLVTLCFAFGYFSSMKFSSKFTYYMFESILIIRPVLLLFYSLITATRYYTVTLAQKKKLKKQAKKEGK